MKLAYLYDRASLVPFLWMMASLVLDPHSVTYVLRCKGFGMFTPLVLVNHVTVSQCLFS